MYKGTFLDKVGGQIREAVAVGFLRRQPLCSFRALWEKLQMSRWKPLEG